MAVVTSGTDAKPCYCTDSTTCTCRAGAEGDPVCMRRALYWHERAELDLDPEPTLSGSPAKPCDECLDTGYIRIYVGSRLSDWSPGRCLRCTPKAA